MTTDIAHPRTLTVLTRQYPDGSAFEVVRVYADEKRAREDFQIVVSGTTWVWKLHDTPFFESTGESV